MKFQTECKDFQKALSFVVKGIATRTTQPILSNVLLVAGDKISLRATNLVIDLQTSFAADIKEKGSIVIPPEQLLGFLSASSGEVSVSVSKLMSITAGKGKIRLTTIPADEFPTWQEFEPLLTLKLDKNLVRNIFDSVDFAVAKDARRPILTGTYFNAFHKLVVGADGTRMAIVKLNELAGEFTCVISQQGIEEVKRMTTLDDGDITINFGERYTLFTSENYRIIANHLAGNYPENAIGVANKLKEREHLTEVRIKKASLLKVFGVANLFQSGLVSTPVRLTCDGEIYAEIDSEAGYYKDTIEGEIIRGKVSILLSPSQFIDIASKVKEEMILKMGDPHQPILISDPSNDNWSVVQVPIADKEGVEKWEAEKKEQKPKVEVKPVETKPTDF